MGTGLRTIVLTMVFMTLPYASFAQDTTTQNSPNVISTEPLQLFITSDKETYRTGEEINIIVELKNAGSEPVSIVAYEVDVNRVGHRSGFIFKVEDDEGKEIPYGHTELLRKMAAPRSLTVIDAGATYSLSVKLRQWFRIDSAGMYHVTCTFSQGPHWRERPYGD